MPVVSTAPADRSAPVTVSITRTVRPEDEALMQVWADAGTTLARRFPGFLGSGWVRPSLGSDQWHMLYRFADADALEQWQESHERARWLGAAARLVEATRMESRTGIEGWFDEPHEVTGGDIAPPAPPRSRDVARPASAPCARTSTTCSIPARSSNTATSSSPAAAAAPRPTN